MWPGRAQTRSPSIVLTGQENIYTNIITASFFYDMVGLRLGLSFFITISLLLLSPIVVSPLSLFFLSFHCKTALYTFSCLIFKQVMSHSVASSEETSKIITRLWWTDSIFLMALSLYNRVCRILKIADKLFWSEVKRIWRNKQACNTHALTHTHPPTHASTHTHSLNTAARTETMLKGKQ